jgi:peptide chain release factor 1
MADASTTEAALFSRWSAVAQRYDELTRQLTDPSVLSQPSLLHKLNKERTELESLAQLFVAYRDVLRELEEADHMLKDPAMGELQGLAAEESKRLQERRREMEGQALELLVPKDPRDEKNTFVEIRAGTGGDEAALFAGDLFRMYVKYGERKRLRVEVVESHETGIGGYKDVIMLVEGKGAYRHFKHESGVHRVQRVPITEGSGRIHTSTVTVAVMPEVEEVDIQIDPKDLRIDTFCSSGAGGQSVNTTYSAVRITHLPTGVVVTCQDERSQLKNRNKAMRTLRARIMETERAKQEAEIAQTRKSQVGTGDRSEKIRTYNFPQNRVTDHRVGLTLHKLDQILGGDLDELVEALQAAHAKPVASEALCADSTRAAETLRGAASQGRPRSAACASRGDVVGGAWTWHQSTWTRDRARTDRDGGAVGPGVSLVCSSGQTGTTSIPSGRPGLLRAHASGTARGIDSKAGNRTSR